MASKVVFAAVVVAIFGITSAQVIRNCGCGGVDVIPNVIPNQVFLNQGLLQPGFLQQGLLAQPGLVAGNVVAPNVVAPCVNGQYALPAANIIQDNSVATNLANTLQLLLVSNLLSNTLPNQPDLLTVPAVSPYGGLSYIC